MAELHIDDDWKRQAQEEKKRLAEEAEKRRQAAQAPVGGLESAAAAGAVAGAVSPTGAGAGRGARGQRGMPEASFGSVVQSMMTQALYYLGELATAGGEGAVNLDMAKHQLDVLGILEEKTKGNLSADEQRLMDAALYETRMRFVSVASQYVNPY